MHCKISAKLSGAVRYHSHFELVKVGYCDEKDIIQSKRSDVLHHSCCKVAFYTISFIRQRNQFYAGPFKTLNQA